MQYPLYIHRQAGGGYRGHFPDLPDADVHADAFGELERNAQDVVQRMYHRSEQLIPAPTHDTSALQTLDMDDGKGLWLFVDIDLSRVVSRAVSIQLSMSRSVLRDVEATALAHRMTRSAFIALACLREMRYTGVEGAQKQFKTRLALLT
ncbi:type II toxin-antitoxin system HicB family antitoxin [Paraburkholderia megapolitana]|uniref:Predicted nuclease of the RNAse H fold, HicB family n=1 Tax=Paraburkholderia megapolitana TaxID=420953 RepID=A0A1I3Q7P5_9BURK|nr:type II toxin-antitoxin system HicB family antitoxin [Paraburkholderia megapolitana]QDQ81122.1 HicB family protein [Paraburkholderia megapolitana]SFJ29136.1 Predicted nuclease of the RNAse H fold, HicB family [Paraburkholderia megapolitana]